MQKEQFLEILEKYRSGKASEEEITLLNAYYDAFDLRPDILETMPDEDQQKLEWEMSQYIDSNISATRVLEFPKLNRNIAEWSAYAAVILILIVSSVFLKNKLDSDKQLSQKEQAPPVQQSNNFIQLPDGSTVIISAGSKIDYPESFDKQKVREVYLTGEAYFDIQHNASKPFIVHSGKLTTTVLGTAFNIRALPGDKSITITVTRGKVKVNDQRRTFGVLLPDQQVVYDNSKQDVKQETVDAEKTVEWKKQDLFFDDVTIANATRLIEERFDIKIQIDGDQLKSKRFTTTLGKNESLESVLNSIAVFNDANYKISAENKLVILSPNN